MPQRSIVVREYVHVDSFNRDAQNMAKYGWYVVSTVSQEQKKGVLKTIVSPLTRKKSHIIVTYAHDGSETSK